MVTRQAVVLTTLLWTGVSGQKSEYCLISRNHSLCTTLAPTPFCSTVYTRGLSQTEAETALDEHNLLRSQIAVGSHGQPPAGDMMELQWDVELARVAQARADSCVFQHECSDCRRVQRFKVGQNLFRARDNRVEAAEWRHIIRSWFSEVTLFPGLGNIARYRYTPGTGHYTQMVWSSVTRVGCGYITYRNTETEPLVARYYVCDYGPGGNLIGDKMYQPGPACSSCPTGSTCTSRYVGLCSYDNKGFIDNNSIENSPPSDQFFSRAGRLEASRPENIPELRSRTVQRKTGGRQQILRSRVRTKERNRGFRRRQQVSCDIICAIGRILGF